MLWNEFDYYMQVKVMDYIASNVLKSNIEENVKEAVVAALNELDMWSNSPCIVIEDIEVALAQDPYIEK